MQENILQLLDSPYNIQEPNTMRINKRSCPFVKYGKDDLSVKYIGRGLRFSDVASIQSNLPASQETLIYYYELHISNLGQGGMTVGFGEGNFPLGKQPGWTKHSFGFKADGKVYHKKQAGSEIFPKFATGNTIGCGINFFKREIFFTINGDFCGVAFKNIPLREYYPTISLRSLQENIKFNFGDKPFKYNIFQKIQEEKEECSASVLNKPLSDYSLHQIIHAYLNFHGYASTLEAFEAASRIKGKDVNLLRKKSLENGDREMEEEEEKREVKGTKPILYQTGDTNMKAKEDTCQTMEIETKKDLHEFEIDEEIIPDEREPFSPEFEKPYSIDKDELPLFPMFLTTSSTQAIVDKTKKNDDFQIIEPSSNEFGLKESKHHTSFLYERAGIRKLIKEGKIDEAVLTIQILFPKMLQENNELTKAIYAQQFIELIKNQDYFSAIQIAQTHLASYQRESVYCFDSKESNKLIGINDLMGLLCYPNPEQSHLKNLLTIEQRELTADIVNKCILDMVGFLDASTLEILLAQLSKVRGKFLEKNLYFDEIFKLISIDKI